MDTNTSVPGPFLPEDLGPFDSSHAAWESGLSLLNSLYFLRGMCPSMNSDHEAAAKIISAFCRRLRRTPDRIDLARIVRSHRLTNECVIVLLGVVATFFEVGAFRRFRDPVILAVGFHPRRLAALYAAIESRGGIGALVSSKDDTFHPTPRLLELITTLSTPDWDAMRRQIRSLPTSSRNS